jgi:hypothetical protein
MVADAHRKTNFYVSLTLYGPPVKQLALRGRRYERCSGEIMRCRRANHPVVVDSGSD